MKLDFAVCIPNLKVLFSLYIENKNKSQDSVSVVISK